MKLEIDKSYAMVLITAVAKTKHTAWENDFATGATGLHEHINPTSIRKEQQQPPD